MRPNRCRPLACTRATVALALVRQLTVNSVNQQFGEAQDGIERCPQFVAHIREELRLVAAGCRQAPAFILYLAGTAWRSEWQATDWAAKVSIQVDNLCRRILRAHGA